MKRYFLFETAEAAQAVSFAIKGKWDLFNGVEVSQGFDYEALSLAASLSDTEYCDAGNACSLAHKESFAILKAFYRGLHIDESSNAMLLMDESSILFPHDAIKAEIRSVSGVPDAKYQVDGERVFVFDALVNAVESMHRVHMDWSLEDLVRAALPSAWLTAQEAVAQYEIVPSPYKVITVSDVFAICHQPFDCLLPPRFTSQIELQQALARLLLGEVLPGEGAFTYKEQPMTPRKPLHPNSLPPMPELDYSSLEPSTASTHTWLRTKTYVEGFPLLTRHEFEDLKTLEDSWALKKNMVAKWTNQHCDRVWAIIQRLNWEPLIQACWDSYHDLDATGMLRQLYPELEVLPDATLYCCYDYYEFDCNHNKYWKDSLCRDDSFLFFLLGCLSVGSQIHGEDACEVGKFVGLVLVQNQSQFDTFEFGKKVFDFNQALGRVTYQISEAVKFFTNADQAAETKGKPIVTLSEVIDMFSGSKQVVQVTQSPTW